MSMSQEEIEALMSGAGDITADDTSDELDQEVVIEDEPVIEDVEIESEDNNIDDILAGIDGIVDDGTDVSAEEDSTEIDSSDMDDILAGIDGIVDDEVPVIEEAKSSASNLEEMIENNQYPMPVKNENKVVNQLNEVADDSEEKASQIFDVLSFILDENNDIQNYNKKMAEFIDKQVTLLESLTVKFPNIDVFRENLESAQELVTVSKELSDKVDGENNKVFEAMELMQYHDINRQKIERVMAVIRKLNSYLNGIFEDDNEKPEVQIAKHISGDSNEIVGADDIDSLIAEFSS